VHEKKLLDKVNPSLSNQKEGEREGLGCGVGETVEDGWRWTAGAASHY